jgi:hypothetical protein
MLFLRPWMVCRLLSNNHLAHRINPKSKHPSRAAGCRAHETRRNTSRDGRPFEPFRTDTAEIPRSDIQDELDVLRHHCSETRRGRSAGLGQSWSPLRSIRGGGQNVVFGISIPVGELREFNGSGGGIVLVLFGCDTGPFGVAIASGTEGADPRLPMSGPPGSFSEN